MRLRIIQRSDTGENGQHFANTEFGLGFARFYGYDMIAIFMTISIILHMGILSNNAININVVKRPTPL